MCKDYERVLAIHSPGKLGEHSAGKNRDASQFLVQLTDAQFLVQLTDASL